MRRSMWKIREPSWSVYESDLLVYDIRTKRPSEERSNLIRKWKKREKANQDLKDEGIFHAEFRLRPDNDNLYLRPARPFYEKYPLCKFSQNEWLIKENDFETSEEAIQLLAGAGSNYPKIVDVVRGYGLKPPSSHMERCSMYWQKTILDDITTVVAEELAREGELPTPEGVEEL